MLIVPPPEMLIPCPPHGPISELRTVIFVEFAIVTQSPLGLVMWRPSTIVPLCPLIFTGPDAVCARDSVTIENNTSMRLSTILNSPSRLQPAALAPRGLSQ